MASSNATIQDKKKLKLLSVGNALPGTVFIRVSGRIVWGVWSKKWYCDA